MPTTQAHKFVPQDAFQNCMSSCLGKPALRRLLGQTDQDLIFRRRSPHSTHDYEEFTARVVAVLDQNVAFEVQFHPGRWHGLSYRIDDKGRLYYLSQTEPFGYFMSATPYSG